MESQVPMERIFQSSNGEINYLNGLLIKRLSCINEIDSETGVSDTILLWLESTDSRWFRIFIDAGAYCGIDEFEFNDIESDLEDDGIVIENFDFAMEGLSISSAIVNSPKLPLIKLTINLNNGIKLVLDSNEDELCRFWIDNFESKNVG